MFGEDRCDISVAPGWSLGPGRRGQQHKGHMEMRTPACVSEREREGSIETPEALKKENSIRLIYLKYW